MTLQPSTEVEFTLQDSLWNTITCVGNVSQHSPCTSDGHLSEVLALVLLNLKGMYFSDQALSNFHFRLPKSVISACVNLLCACSGNTRSSDHFISPLELELEHRHIPGLNGHF